MFQRAAPGRAKVEDDTTPLLSANSDRDLAEEFAKLTQGFQADIRSAPDAKVIPHDSKGYRALDEALDEIGTGRFQHRLLALTAFGHFVEAAEYCLLGLLLPLMEEEFKVQSETELALIGSLTGVGMMCGSTFFAQFSNMFGRRISFQISLTICVLFGFLSSFCESVTAFALMRGMLGFGYGGNLIASTTLLVEFTPSNVRAKYMNLSGIAFAFGAIFVVALAWVTVPIIGWRWLLRIVAFCSLPILMILPILPESPRFYIMRRRTAEAVQVVKKVASTNNKPLPSSCNEEDFAIRSEPVDFKNQCIRLTESWKTTVPLAVVWFTHSFASAVNSFIPLEISKRASAKVNAKYEISIVLSSGCLVGSCILYFTSMHVGRLVQLKAGLFLTAVFTACIGLESTSHIYVYVIGFCLATLSMFPIAMLYLYTGEVHQTETRTMAFAICQLGHRLAPVFSPFAVAALNESVTFAVTGMVFGGVYLVAFASSLFLRLETFGRPLVEADDLDARNKPRLDLLEEEVARLFSNKKG